MKWKQSLGDVFSDAGYANAIFGKWHISGCAIKFRAKKGAREKWAFDYAPTLTFFTRRTRVLRLAPAALNARRVGYSFL